MVGVSRYLGECRPSRESVPTGRAVWSAVQNTSSRLRRLYHLAEMIPCSAGVDPVEIEAWDDPISAIRKGMLASEKESPWVTNFLIPPSPKRCQYRSIQSARNPSTTIPTTREGGSLGRTGCAFVPAGEIRKQQSRITYTKVFSLWLIL